MTILCDSQRTYYVKKIKHIIDDSISFKDVDSSFRYNNKFTNNLYNHIIFTITILDKYIPNKWCAMAGTLLGCVRHQGIIPWDSDADFMVMKKDLMILKKKCKTINKIDKNYEFIFIPMFGMIKIYYKGFCFIDIFGFEFLDTDNITYYAPEIKGVNTFLCHKTFFPNEKYCYSDIFPIVKIQFEDFEMNCPHKYMNILKNNYAPNVLKEIVFPSTSHKKGHSDVLNMKKGLWIIDEWMNWMNQYPYFMKYYFCIVPLLQSYGMFQKYLSPEQKLKYLDYFKEYELCDYYNGNIHGDLFNFFIKNNEPKKILITVFQNFNSFL